MADVLMKFGASTAITITLASLGGTSARESTAVDNQSNLYLDAHVRVKVKLQSGTPSGDKAVYVYAYGSEDGTNYGDNATGSDAAITLRSPTNLRLIGVLSVPDSGALTYPSHPMSVAAAFGGVLPRKWGIVIQNASGVALDATGSNHEVKYTGLTYQTA